MAANSPLPPFVPLCPRQAPFQTHIRYPCDWQILERWKKDSFNFPLYQYLWHNGLTNSETWRCPDADERERLLGLRPDHSRPAVSTSTKNGSWKTRDCVYEDLRRTTVARVFVRSLLPGLPSSSAQHLVLKLVNQFSLKASKISTNLGFDIIVSLFRRPEIYKSRSLAFGSSR